MSTQRYSVTPHPIETLLTWVKSGEIAIPEIQRPFVWEATKVRNLLDSIYKGFPVGYLIAWRNPAVRLKDGTTSSGKRILIDGQQRVTALMAALLGREVLTRDYETVKIRIAFHPLEEKFEVTTPIIEKDAAWISDVSNLFLPGASLMKAITDYLKRNPQADADKVSAVIERVRMIVNNHVGIIELAEDLDIETVTEIFIRVNSAGAQLNQADFVMSKIAANDLYGGNLLRKAIDYFCHLSVSPEFLVKIEHNDPAFSASEFMPKMKWLKDANDDLYDPTYTDMLRVAFTSEFRRGKLQDLVALLSGRNFETKTFEASVAEESFHRLKTGIVNFMNQTHFERMTMILRSAGFATSALTRSQNAINFAYIVYLRGRDEKVAADELERLVRRWYAMSVLRGRYSSNPETAFDTDIRAIETRGLSHFCNSVIDAELPDSFWDVLLPQEMETSSAISPYFIAYQAAQAKMGDLGFLSRDIKVWDLIMNRSDVHHIYPRQYLKNQGMERGRYNQIANFVLAQSEINIQIGAKPPEVYFRQLAEQCTGGTKLYGGITDREEMLRNFDMNCIPHELLDGDTPSFDDFLETRRKLMAAKLKIWFSAL